MSFVLARTKSLSVLHGTVAVEGVEVDIQQPLRPDDILGKKLVRAWPMGVTTVPQAAGQLLMEQIFAVEQPAPPPKSHPLTDDSAVVYEADKVTAYFDSNGRSVAPHFATYAKVWKPDGTLTIITLDQAAIT